MDRKLNLKVGQEVVVKIISGSNMARHIDMSLENINEWCFSGFITKTGRKYVSVKWGEWQEEKFCIEDDYKNKYNCGGANYKLYLNKQEVINEIKADQLYSDIETNFGQYGGNRDRFTLDQLKRITNIINENK